MSLRMISLGLLASLALACGGDPPRSGEPTTAKEKQRREAAAAGDTASQPTARGNGWRYAGDRDECFFMVGRRCYKSEAAACAAARCGSRKCNVDGGGPATVTCAK